MLIERVITAVVLLLVLGLFLFAEPVKPFFPYLCCLISAAVFYEWLTLCINIERSNRVALGAALVFFVLGCICIYYSTPDIKVYREALEQNSQRFLNPIISVLTMLTCLIWLIFVPAILRGGPISHKMHQSFHILLAVLTLTSACAALVYFYIVMGVVFLLTFLATIWVADTAAYFGGRLLKGPKLAPKISPGKTISGAVSGVVGAIIWACLCALWIPRSFSAELLMISSWPVVLIVTAVLAVYSIIGDLYESLIKRRAGAKDSGRLLPGHGGSWDRMDSIVAVAPIAYISFVLVSSNVI